MLFISSVFLLFSNAPTGGGDRYIIYSRVSISVLTSCLILGISSSYLNFYNKGIGLFSGLLQSTVISHIFHAFVVIISAIILVLNSFYPRKVVTESYSSIRQKILFNIKYYNNFILNKMSEQYTIREYALIIQFALMGGLLLMSSCDFITVFLALELQSYALYILCVVYKNSESATSGGLTYFLLGGLSSCFILLASALIYANSGNTGFDGLFVISNITVANLEKVSLFFSSGQLQDTIVDSLSGLYQSNYLNFSLIVMSVGLLFKISASPFHFWSPDVYDAIPTVVTTFVSTFAKISVLVLLLELVHYTSNIVISTEYLLNVAENMYSFSWTSSLLISSFLSLLVGAILGLTQFRIKRLFAYSTISHIGFILLALSVNNIESIQSFIFYLMQYSITNVNIFMVLIAIGYSLYKYTDGFSEKSVLDNTLRQSNVEKTPENNSPIWLISQMKGYFYINPYLALSMAITLFSFVGIPPLAGFFAKQMVLSSALDKGYYFMVLIAIVASAISAYYYLAVVKEMYFNKSSYIFNPHIQGTVLKAQIYNANSQKEIYLNSDNIQLSGSITLIISVLTLALASFMGIPDEILDMATIMALTLFNN